MGVESHDSTGEPNKNEGGEKMNERNEIVTPQFDFWMGKKTAKAHRVTLLERFQMWKARRRWQSMH